MLRSSRRPMMVHPKRAHWTGECQTSQLGEAWGLRRGDKVARSVMWSHLFGHELRLSIANATLTIPENAGKLAVEGQVDHDIASPEEARAADPAAALRRETAARVTRWVRRAATRSNRHALRSNWTRDRTADRN